MSQKMYGFLIVVCVVVLTLTFSAIVISVHDAGYKKAERTCEKME